MAGGWGAGLTDSILIAAFGGFLGWTCDGLAMGGPSLETDIKE